VYFVSHPDLSSASQCVTDLKPGKGDDNGSDSAVSMGTAGSPEQVHTSQGFLGLLVVLLHRQCRNVSSGKLFIRHQQLEKWQWKHLFMFYITLSVVIRRNVMLFFNILHTNNSTYLGGLNII